jgi:hypothetical protein
MRQWIRSHLTYSNVMVTILAFIVLGGVSYAATGGNFILGQGNTADKQTSLSASPAFAGKALQVTNMDTTAGATALGLSVGSGRPPLTVNSGTKVVNLNADKLDGKDSTAFGTGTVKKLIYEDTAGPGGTPTAFATVGPYTFKGDCITSPTNVHLFVNGPAGTADYMYRRATNDTGAFDDRSGRVSISAGSDTEIASNTIGLSTGPTPGSKQRISGTVTIKTGSTIVQVEFNGVADNNSGGSGEKCFLYGTAMMGT